MTEKQMRRFGRWMKESRKAQDVSWYALSKLTGLHATALAKIEKNSTDVRMSSFVKICSALEANPATVLAYILEG